MAIYYMKQIKIIPTLPNSKLVLNIAPAKEYIPEWYKKSSQKIKGLDQLVERNTTEVHKPFSEWPKNKLTILFIGNTP